MSLSKERNTISNNERVKRKMPIKNVTISERISGKRIKECVPKVIEKYDNPNAVVVTVEINDDYDEEDVRAALFEALDSIMGLFGGYPEC